VEDPSIDISFDMAKIMQVRNTNLREALEQNLEDKRDCIRLFQEQAETQKKECEARQLKLTHLKFEHEAILKECQREENLKAN
jgi:hypothetical protein